MIYVGTEKFIIDILEEHFEDLGSLWLRREASVFRGGWDLSRLAELEEQALAHLDGLCLAEVHAPDLAEPALAGKETTAAIAASLTLMRLGSTAYERVLVDAFAKAPEAAREGIRIGMRHSDIHGISGALLDISSTGDPALRLAALDVLAFHRRPPPGNLSEILSVPAELRVRMCEVLGRFGGPWNRDMLLEALDEGSSELQRVALMNSARLGMPDLLDFCRRKIQSRGGGAPAVVEFLGVAGEVRDLPMLLDALREPALAVAALRSMGALGRVEAVPALLEAMKQEDLNGAAGEAFARITGGISHQGDKAIPPPEGLTEDELDDWEPVVPWDPGKARLWWTREKNRFSVAGRFQGGVDIHEKPLGGAFNALALNVRRDIYLGERARNFGQTPDLELERMANFQLARPLPS